MRHAHKNGMTSPILNTGEEAGLRKKRFQEEEIPSIGLGTYELQGQACEKAIAEALNAGYRHFDTAPVYENLPRVGNALKAAQQDRDSFFLTSKVWHDSLEPKKVIQSLEDSLRHLQTDYLDLALIHWPNPQIALEDTLEAFAEARNRELIRFIGVSNFPSALLKRALEWGPIFCNQVEYHPFLDQTAVLQVAESNDVVLTAYSPLAQGGVLDDEVLNRIGKKHGKNAGQIALRWLIEQSPVIAIPRSANPEHIRGNCDIFDFALDEEDRKHIDSLPKNRRQIDPEFAPPWD